MISTRRKPLASKPHPLLLVLDVSLISYTRGSESIRHRYPYLQNIQHKSMVLVGQKKGTLPHNRELNSDTASPMAGMMNCYANS